MPPDTEQVCVMTWGRLGAQEAHELGRGVLPAPGPVSPWQVTAPSSSRVGVKGANKSSNRQRCQRVADSDSLIPARSVALCCNRRTVNPRESAEHRTCASFRSRLDILSTDEDCNTETLQQQVVLAGASIARTNTTTKNSTGERVCFSLQLSGHT